MPVPVQRHMPTAQGLVSARAGQTNRAIGRPWDDAFENGQYFVAVNRTRDKGLASYSPLSTLTGSTCVARRAGTNAAAIPTTPSTAAIVANVTAS